MRRFEEQWRRLARTAGTPGPAVPPAPDEGQVAVLMARGRERSATESDPFGRRAPRWALPAAAVLVLYVLALPVTERAWTNTLALENPLKLVPRAPAVPPPPVPTPPAVPRPPVTGSTEWLETLMKEMQP